MSQFPASEPVGFANFAQLLGHPQGVFDVVRASSTSDGVAAEAQRTSEQTDPAPALASASASETDPASNPRYIVDMVDALDDKTLRELVRKEGLASLRLLRVCEIHPNCAQRTGEPKTTIFHDNIDSNSLRYLRRQVQIEIVVGQVGGRCSPLP